LEFGTYFDTAVCGAYQYGKVGADNVTSSSHPGLYKKDLHSSSRRSANVRN